MGEASDHRLEVEYRSLDRLIPYTQNARTHSDEQVAEIAASIRAFGWTNPILVDGEDGVIAGGSVCIGLRMWCRIGFSWIASGTSFRPAPSECG